MNKPYHAHPSVNFALNYLRTLGCPITGEVVLAAQMLWGETQDHETTATDTSIILSGELLQRAMLTLCSGKPQTIELAVPMLDVMHGTVQAVADELEHELPGTGNDMMEPK